MNIKMIKHLAGLYRLSPEKRAQILRRIYKEEGKEGIQSFGRALGVNSVEPFIKWAEKDYNNTRRIRRKRKLLAICNPPSPPGQRDYSIRELFEELSPVSGGSKIGSQGGRRSIYSGQAWDAINGGGK